MTTEDGPVAEAIQRLQQLADNAAMLRELCVPPKENSRTNANVYRAQYIVDGQVVSACLVVKAGEPPMAQVTKRFAESLTASQVLTGPTVTAEDHATFLGLDACEPRTPQWKQDKLSNSDIMIVRGAIGQPLNGRQN